MLRHLAPLAPKRNNPPVWTRSDCASDDPRPPAGRIDHLTTVRLGGIDQAIHFHGDDVTLPILLFLHGGPGLPYMPFAHANAELAKSFLLIHWDQRGAGKSFSPTLTARDMSIEQIVSDACELLRWLHRHFAPTALVLVGHSWGSALGALVAARCPHLVSVYVGVGQVTNLRLAEEVRFSLCVKMAHEQGNLSASAALRRLGPPPYSNQFDSDSLERQAGRLARNMYQPTTPVNFARLAGSSPIYSALDRRKISLGRRFSEACLWHEIFTTIDLFRQVPQLDMPAYFLVGSHDMVVTHVLAEQYFASLVAPQGKTFVTMDSAGHWPHLEAPEQFRNILKRMTIRPQC